MESVYPLKAALQRVHAVVKKKESHVIHTNEISRADRTLLLHLHWLEEITRGWYLFVRPDIPVGDSTAWYASFWDFLKNYLQHHYSNEYCLSAESSLDLHVGNTVIPKQVIVMAKKGSGTPLQLPGGISLLVYTSRKITDEKQKIRDVWGMSLPYALCKVSPVYFQISSQEAKIALCSIKSTSELLRIIVGYNFKSAAERLIGAYRHLGNNDIANEIKAGLLEVGILISEIDPFISDMPEVPYRQFQSPYVGRIHTMWDQYRQIIIDHFPKPPGLPDNPDVYLAQMAEKYTQDAYNSLSIEGYRVSKELIERVMNAEWSPDNNQQDRDQKDALAARGYYEAHLLVKASVEKILDGENPGVVAQIDLSRWFQKLFSPSVQSGILAPADLFGYRRHQVYIRGSRHTPPSREYLGELMEALFQRLTEEPHAGVRAILGHFIFVYIHPYMDGNGRIGRFLMNAMLASGGYPWTIIRVVNRNQYIKALESASAEGDILAFTKFVASELAFV